MISIWLIVKIVACFGLGAIPFAKVAMWGTGIDITKVGSKNPGFNNVLRVSTKPRAAEIRAKASRTVKPSCNKTLAAIIPDRPIPARQ